MSKEKKAIELARFFRRGEFAEPNERYKFNSTRQVVWHDGKLMFRLERRRFKFDRILREWQKPTEWTTYHELEEFGAVKQLEISIVTRKTRQNENFEEEHGYFVQTFIVKVPNLKKHKYDYLSLSPDGKPCLNPSMSACYEIISEKFLTSEFVEPKGPARKITKTELDKLLREKKVYPALFRIRGNRLERIGYEFKG